MSKVFDLNKDIEDIIDYFDFEKCHKVMTLLDWHWYPHNSVPSIGEMRQFARELVRDAVRNMFEQETVTKEYTVECGGFLVKAEQEYPGQKVYISLRFNVTSWDNYD